MPRFTKTFGFSAAHRLHSAHLSDEENQAVFGKCNNVHGHGHNYTLDVTVEDDIDPRTGQIVDVNVLDDVVRTVVIERFDHKHLNAETDEFRHLNPTGENIVKVIWDLLRPRLGPRLVLVGLWETPKSRFDYCDDAHASEAEQPVPET